MRISYANVVATLALILAVGGTAFAASTPGSSAPATLKLCAAKKNGDLRLLPAGGGCKANERAVVVDRQGVKGATGATGAPGPAGPQGERGAQGERGPAGPSTVLTSPDGRFTVAATNAGIVLSGPQGRATFDGEALLADASLTITAPLNFTLTAGNALAVTSGGSTSWTTGTSFTQDVGANVTQNVGSVFSQAVGGAFVQNIAKTFTQEVGDDVRQTLDGDVDQRVDGDYTMDVGKAIAQQATTTYELRGAAVNLTAGSCVKARGGTNILNVC